MTTTQPQTDMPTYDPSTWDAIDYLHNGCDALSGVVSAIAMACDGLGVDPMDPATWTVCTWGESCPMGICPDTIARHDTCQGIGYAEYAVGGDSADGVTFGHVTCAMVATMVDDIDDGTPVSTWTYHHRQCAPSTWDRFGQIHGITWDGIVERYGPVDG